MQCDSGAAVYEFFAGGGLARLGLGSHWRVTFANDYDPAKVRAYRAAFGDAVMVEGDVWGLSAEALPGRARLAWASFPCQDLSLAGARAGLQAARSGTFYGFLRLMTQLAEEGRAPDLLALENVVGLFSSGDGGDLGVICAALARLGYWTGALEIDAALFVPQSRPRAFLVANRGRPPPSLCAPAPQAPFHSRALCAAAGRLEGLTAHRWVWWRLPTPPMRNSQLAQIVELGPEPPWNPVEKTAALLGLMHPRHRAAVQARQTAGGVHVGALFKRIRIENGERTQRAEPRFDGLAGCLRTPAGGSSRQTLIVVDNGAVRTRLISPREAARLMGAPDDFPIPERTNEALKLFGDGVAAPVVAWLSDHLLAPLAGIGQSAAA